MRCNHLLILCLCFCLPGKSFGQNEKYTISKVSFSSGLHDEFSPVFYGDGIAFCSNLKDNSLVSYREDQNGLFNIFYATRKGTSGWKFPVLLSSDITTGYNEGPVTFNLGNDLMYFSRNNEVEKSLRNVSDTSNKLGIYSAELIDGIWTNITSFSYNDPLYSFCTPSLAPDGKRLYFSSDMPGGIGGMDLYYCNWKGTGWDLPVNLGPLINTPGNESFPFAGLYGKLYFASDGHLGFGGKDLFYTLELNGKWIAPVHLDPPINSEADDFGIVTDSTFNSGFFSSNRNHTDDIFSFSSAPVTFDQCVIQSENNYCFTFYDEQYALIDTIPVRYEWDFGDSVLRLGKEVKHCFPGPGDYLVTLTIFDEMTGEAIADHVGYKVALEDIEQPYINSCNIGISGDTMVFDATNTFLKNTTITDYLWDFGEGFNQGGPLMTTAFSKQGEHVVRLGLLVNDSDGISSKVCVMKRIMTYKGYETLEPAGDELSGSQKTGAGTAEIQNISLPVRIGLMDDLSARQKTAVRGLMNRSGSTTIRFDPYGIAPVSWLLLDSVSGFLKENPDIRLEMIIHHVNDASKVKTDKTAVNLAQELSFYLRNSEVDSNSYGCKGLLSGQSFINSDLYSDNPADGVVEFLFMENIRE